MFGKTVMLMIPFLAWGAMVSAGIGSEKEGFLFPPRGSGLSFDDIKDADFSGAWYPADKQALAAQVEGFLERADPATLPGDVLGIICPHAGIVYSGQTAAYGFKAVAGRAIDTVVVLGFSHRRPYSGIAVFGGKGVETPLGTLYTDRQLSEEIAAEDDSIFLDDKAFVRENSVELILPFIQSALGAPKIVLLAIGNQDWPTVRAISYALANTLKQRRNFLIVASTDMSHYLPYKQAMERDDATVDFILNLSPQEMFSRSYGHNRMCGAATVAALALTAKRLSADKAVVLHRSTSADAAGDRSNVVGYLSAAFVRQGQPEEEKALLTHNQRQRLLKLARAAIGYYLDKGKVLPIEESDPALRRELGVFVTLHKRGRLRGCIGNIVGQKPLYLGARDMAVAAAVQDPRFSPLSAKELADIDIEISVLSPLREIGNPDEIVLGRHGVLVKDGLRSGVYLPQVATETGWDKERFMNSLCADKAGMAADAWKTGRCKIFVFTAEVFGEREEKKEAL